MLTANNLRLEQQVNQQIEKGAKIIGEVGKAQKEVAKVANSNILEGGFFGGTGNGISDGGIDAVLPKIQGLVTGSEFELAKLRGYFGYTEEELTRFVSNYGLSFEQLLTTTEMFSADISNALNSGLINAFTGIGEALGNALAQGNNVVQALGSSILGTFGDILIQLGKIAIETGIGIAAIKAALKSLNPVVAIGAGVALIALGSLIKGKIANVGGANASKGNAKAQRGIPQFADGGVVYGNTLAQVGEYPGARSNPEVIAPLNKLKDIIGDRGSNVNISAGLSISMREFVLEFRKEEKLMARNG